MDMLEVIGEDSSAKVLMGLGDPAYLVRASSVSKSWYQFVITHGLCKQLCMKMCPELSIFRRVSEENNSFVIQVGSGSSRDTEWSSLEREHKICSYLSHCLVSPMAKEDCILKAVGASSTDNVPDESIEHTLQPSDRMQLGPSYWSSKGGTDPTVPESLTYGLKSNLCVVHEIKIRPFKAFFQFGHPVYPSKSVRFRMGYSKLARKGMDAYVTGQQPTDDNYIWIYVSPEFPMAEDNTLQSFKLPRPVVCIGGIVQIELLGKVQRQQLDRQYYVCICHVKVVGRNLSPDFSCDFPHNGALISSVLKYFPEARAVTEDKIRKESSPPKLSSWQNFTKRLRELMQRPAILNRLLGES